MTVRLTDSSPRRASPLRFLLFCLGGWTVLRVMMNWNPAIPPALDDADRPPAALSPFALVAALAVKERSGIERAVDVRPIAVMAPGRTGKASPAPAPAVVADGEVGSGSRGLSSDRHSLRLALMTRLFPASRMTAAALPARGGWSSMPSVAGAEPGRAKPFWMHRQMAGWSLGSWLYMREASSAVPGGIGAASQLGASQGGMRIAYGFGETGRLRAYGRATLALQRPQQRELAYGFAFAPMARWPVDIAVERRLAVGPEGRTALAAMVTAGISGVALPGDFRLDAYGQAGVVGARRRDGFADGAVVIDRRLGADEEAPLRLGALAAGAVQPGAARIDIGPRLTLRLPDVGEGSRIALDWRQRVAGNADPESGVALTLASDF